MPRRQRLAPVERPVGCRQPWHQRHGRDVPSEKRRRRLARPGGLAQVRRRAERQGRPQHRRADRHEPRPLGGGLVQRRTVHLQHLAALRCARPRQPAAGQPDVAADVVDRAQQHDAVIEPQGAVQHRRRRLAGSESVQGGARPAVRRRIVLDGSRVGNGQRALTRGQPVDRPVERALRGDPPPGGRRRQHRDRGGDAERREQPPPRPRGDPGTGQSQRRGQATQPRDGGRLHVPILPASATLIKRDRMC